MDDGWAVKRESTILRESTFGLWGESERFNPDVSDILSTEDRYRVAPRKRAERNHVRSRDCDSNIEISFFFFFFHREQQFPSMISTLRATRWNGIGIIVFRWRTPFTAPPPLTAIWQYVCAAKTWTLCWTWRFINRVTSLRSLRWSTTRSFRTSLTTWWKILRCSTGITSNNYYLDEKLFYIT